MTDFIGTNSASETVSNEDEAADKIRGRIPKFAWGYVRGQYEIAKRTYEDIGTEFNCTPSAVFYVVKQARDRDIPATLDAPDPTQISAHRPSPQHTALRAQAALDRVVANANREFAQKQQAEPAPDPMAQLDNYPMTKRYLTAAGEVGKLIMAWEADRTEANWQAMEDKMKDVRKADAAIQIARYQTPSPVAANSTSYAGEKTLATSA